jgi:hypothetical protein
VVARNTTRAFEHRSETERQQMTGSLHYQQQRWLEVETGSEQCTQLIRSMLPLQSMLTSSRLNCFRRNFNGESVLIVRKEARFGYGLKKSVRYDAATLRSSNRAAQRSSHNARASLEAGTEGHLRC